MNRTDHIKLLFIVVGLVIPTLVHSLFAGQYVVTSDGRPVSYELVKTPPNSPGQEVYVANRDVGRRTFWIGPVSSTLPFIFLVLLFLTHCGRLKSKSRRSAYCGALAAWLSMMGFTIYVVSHTRSMHLSSTIGIAVVLTPFCYIPFLFLPYIAGTIVGIFCNKRIRPRTAN
jgi:hypothetical protein